MKKILILSHTDISRKFHPAGLGEIVNSAKFASLMQQMGYPVQPILDIYTLCGEPYDQTYRDLFRLNLDLAELDYPILERSELEGAKQILNRVQKHSPDLIFILSWHWTLAALFACGIQSLSPVVSKFYVLNARHRVLTPLYAPSDLLITECLLANMKGIEYGIPAWKMIYLPHHFPDRIEQIKPDTTYLKRIAFANNKPLNITDKTVVIGMVSRLGFRKNCHYAWEAVSKLIEQRCDILLLVKGTFDGDQPILKEKMTPYLHEPWFLWDQTSTPFPQVLSEYKTFDLFVHVSGREGASNVVVEMLALGVPTVVLDATTNPYLFKGGALFVKNDGLVHRSELTFQAPDPNDLEETLKELVDSRFLREQWKKRGKTLANIRFHPDLTRQRLPLIFEAAESYRRKEGALQKKVEALYKADCERYELA